MIFQLCLDLFNNTSELLEIDSKHKYIYIDINVFQGQFSIFVFTPTCVIDHTKMFRKMYPDFFFRLRQKIQKSKCEKKTKTSDLY